MRVRILLLAPMADIIDISNNDFSGGLTTSSVTTTSAVFGENEYSATFDAVYLDSGRERHRQIMEEHVRQQQEFLNQRAREEYERRGLRHVWPIDPFENTMEEPVGDALNYAHILRGAGLLQNVRSPARRGRSNEPISQLRDRLRRDRQEIFSGFFPSQGD